MSPEPCPHCDSKRWVCVQHLNDPFPHATSRTCNAEPSVTPTFVKSCSNDRRFTQARRAGARNRVTTMNGTISRVLVDKGFGFITGEDRQEYFMHRGAIRD